MLKQKYIIAALSAFSNAIVAGICTSYSSTATESMQSSSLQPSENHMSWIGSLLPLGAIFGGIIAGYLTDIIGRKGVMVYLSLPFISGWLLIAFATSLPFVYAGRFITGICDGIIFVVTPMYVVEIVPPHVRGYIGGAFPVFIISGIILVSILGIFLKWNWVAITAAILALFPPIFMFFMPDSPPWLLRKDRYDEAANAMHFLYGSPAQFIYEDHEAYQANKIISIDVTDPAVYKPAILSLFLMLFHQFSGINAILYYTVYIFRKTGIPLDPFQANLIVSIVMCLFSILGAVLLDTLGRKWLMIISALFTGVALNCLALYLFLLKGEPSLHDHYSWIPIPCLIVYIAAFSIGLGTIPWLMMSELSPTYARSAICGFGTAFSWTFGFIVSKGFLDIQQYIQNFGVYWIFCIFCLLCCVFTSCLPETKGKTFEEIKHFFVPEEPPSPESHKIDEEENDRAEKDVTSSAENVKRSAENDITQSAGNVVTKSTENDSTHADKSNEVHPGNN